MKEKNELNGIDKIVGVIQTLKSKEEIRQFLAEMLTDKELKDLNNRWLLLEALDSGSKQRQIAKDFGISLCKITRGSKILKDETSIVTKIFKN